MSIKRKIPVTNKIAMFLHCKKCLDELPGDQSPRDYATIEAGWTKIGLQLWCKRHDKNILHVDFEGQKHPAVLHARRH
ncbi:MAG: hypothetical protein QGF64_07340 [Candidatus Poseidoniia archaeon]|jgi:hypothetical protein|nr:hypothetical protein [Candidatus Poseidoniia archaeon]|tara:strand:+ start:376 stop:609 length:234 start_codon:yes stop_codon:yes gene_type:complete